MLRNLEIIYKNAKKNNIIQEEIIESFKRCIVASYGCYNK